MAKSPNAFRTISEVASWLGTQSHVLRFWESKFDAVDPVQRTGGRRYYRQTDMMLLGGIKFLLHEQGMTIKAVQRLLKDEGIAHVQSYSPKINIIELSNIPKQQSSETMISHSDKPIDFLNDFHNNKIGTAKSKLQSEHLEHKDQRFLFPELQLELEQVNEKATIVHVTAKPSDTNVVVKPTPPLLSRAGLSKMDPDVTKFVGKISPVTLILKLSIAEQSRLVRDSTHIIAQLQQLQKKLST